MNIVVIALNRPFYLYVMLSSLFAVRGIEKYPVNVFFDGGLDAITLHKQLETVFMFPVNKAVFRTSNIGCLQNHILGIKAGFDDGAGEVLYLMDDYIMRSDMLEYVETVPRDADFYSLFGNAEGTREEYCPMGNVMPRETFYPLYYWVQAKKYMGTERPGFGYLLGDTRTEDAVFYSYQVIHHLITRFPAKSYVAHFGLSGLNYPANAEAERQFEEYMFSGDKNEWLPRIIRILETRDIPAGVNKERFLPERFIYV